jgi:type VI secretion system VgrG family protein
MKDILSVRLESPAFTAGAVELYALSGRETISQLFELELQLVSKDPMGLDEEALLSEPMTVIFLRGDTEVRRMFGMVVSVRDALQTETLHLAYTLTFVPRAFRMTLTETSEIFMDLTVPEIIKKKLERAGLREGDDFELRLAASYPPREYVVQYKETDLQFVSRLAEHLGISFFFEHRDGRDVIVFSDDNSGFQPIAGGGRAPFYARGEHMGVHRLQGTTRTIPNRYVVKDYNYRTPHVPLMASATVSEAAAGDIVEYGAHFKTPDEGERIAAIRAEELRAGRKVFEGESDVQVFSAGARLTLEGHPRGDVELLLVEVRHRLRQGALGTGSGSEHAYTNEFRAIPFKTPYRPPRITPKPRVHGVIPGIVEAAAKGKYAEIDEAGRYHVRFIFDTSSAEVGQASRPVRMAQPHAGPGYGFHFPLRSGVEVILTCIDGDPDRPIIAGAVPNPQTPTTVDAKNARRNVIRTGGNNEINIDDTEGEERIKLSTPFGGSVFQLGSPNTPEAGAAISTAEAFTALGAAGVNTLTSVSTLISDFASIMTSADILNYAGGAASLASALAEGKGEKLVDDLLKTAKSALDIPKKWDDYRKADANEKVVQMDENAKRKLAYARMMAEYPAKDPPLVRNPDGSQRPMTQEEWEAQHPEFNEAREAAKEAANAKTEADKLAEEIAEEEQTRRIAGIGLDAASGLKDGVKVVSAGAKAVRDRVKGKQELLNDAAQARGKATKMSAVAVAKSMIAGAGSAAKVPRVPGSVPSLGSPHFVGGADNSAVLIGLSDAFVGGAACATLAAGGEAIVSGGAVAMLKSPGIATIGGTAKALITSTALVDILSGSRYVAKAGGTAKFQSGGAMTIITSSTLDLKAIGNMSIKSCADASLAAINADIKCSGDLKAKAINIGVGASTKAEVSGGAEAHVLGGGWGLKAKSGQVTAGNGDVGLKVTGGDARIKKGGSQCLVTGASAVLAKGGSRVECTSGGTKINGSRIDLG